MMRRSDAVTVDLIQAVDHEILIGPRPRGCNAFPAGVLAAATGLDRISDPIGVCLTPEISLKIADARIPSDVQLAIDDLADRCTEGLLSEAERVR